MKKHLTLLLLVLGLSISCYSQRDQITLRNGRTIYRCTIYKIDTVAKMIEFRRFQETDNQKLKLNEVASYTWQGEVNKGLGNIKIDKPEEPVSPSNAFTSGKLFIHFANNAQAGIAIMTVGSMLSASSILFVKTKPDIDSNKPVNSFKTSKIVAGVGLGLSLTGLIVYASSFNYVRKAGVILDYESRVRLGVTENGVGVTIPIR